MLIRFGLIGLLIHYVSSATILQDHATSKWVKEVIVDDSIRNASLNKHHDSNSAEYEDTDETLDLSPSNQNDATCTMPSGKRGVCVTYYQCNNNKKIIEDGSELIDIRESSPCPTFLDVCCSEPNTDTEENVITNTEGNHRTTEVNLNSEFEPQSEDKMQSNLDRSKDGPLSLMEQAILKAEGGVVTAGQCGWSNPDLYLFKDTDKKRIYAEYGEFPWMVAIMKRTGTTVWSPNDYIGGGTIIHPSVVVTVSYKVDRLSVNEIKCRGGEWDTSSTKEQYPIQERNVVDKTLHPRYYRNSAYNAAALLFLETPFDLDNAPHMGPACLNSVLPRPGEECFTMGWGKDLVKNITYAVVLKKTKLPLVKVDTCEKALRNTRFGPFFRLHDSLTCAGGEEGIDACQGDGGSPLVCPIETIGSRVRYAVVGLVAYGISCGKEDLPGVYVKIPELYSWINGEMTKRNYGMDTYKI